MQPFVSVLLPVYNGALFLRGALESVLAQNYHNFELIICDNASTDTTPAIIAEYSCDERVRVFRNRKTLPRLDNFNLVFEAAHPSAVWYKFIGDDDRLLPGCLEEMIATGEAHQSAGLVCSYYYNAGKLVKGAVAPGVNLVRGPEILKKMLLEAEARQTIFSPASLLIKPEAYHEAGGFKTEMLHADAELFYRILNRHDLAYVHQPLVKIGYHAASGQAKSTESGDTFKEAYQIRYHNLKLYDQVKLKPLEREKIKANLVNDSVGYILARLFKGVFKQAFKHLKVIPPAAFYHLPLSAFYFLALALKKLVRKEKFNLFKRQEPEEREEQGLSS